MGGFFQFLESHFNLLFNLLKDVSQCETKVGHQNRFNILTLSHCKSLKYLDGSVARDDVRD